MIPARNRHQEIVLHRNRNRTQNAKTFINVSLRSQSRVVGAPELLLGYQGTQAHRDLKGPAEALLHHARSCHHRESKGPAEPLYRAAISVLSVHRYSIAPGLLSLHRSVIIVIVATSIRRRNYFSLGELIIPCYTRISTGLLSCSYRNFIMESLITCL